MNLSDLCAYCMQMLTITGLCIGCQQPPQTVPPAPLRTCRCPPSQPLVTPDTLETGRLVVYRDVEVE